MSECGNNSGSPGILFETDEEVVLSTLRDMKEGLDVLVSQLSTGDYASPDTFANNWAHLSLLSQDISTYLRSPGVMDMIVRTDLLLAADLIAVSRFTAIMENFMACTARRAG